MGPTCLNTQLTRQWVRHWAVSITMLILRRVMVSEVMVILTNEFIEVRNIIILFRKKYSNEVMILHTRYEMCRRLVGISRTYIYTCI